MFSKAKKGSKSLKNGYHICRRIIKIGKILINNEYAEHLAMGDY
jgi:hypothetical protein